MNMGVTGQNVVLMLTQRKNELSNPDSIAKSVLCVLLYIHAKIFVFLLFLTEYAK